jgi:hypothetical protein
VLAGVLKFLAIKEAEYAFKIDRAIIQAQAK